MTPQEIYQRYLWAGAITRNAEALAAYRQGIEAARKKGDRQAEKEMTVFMRRLEKAAPGPGQDPK